MFVAYYRVSTDRQGRSGLGLEAQREAITAYTNRSGTQIKEEFTEIESGSKNSRPELEKAIVYCKKHRATLLIAKLDRLSRNLHFITGLMVAKIDFVAADNPHANKLMLHMLAAFAEHEREMIAERTQLALAAAKERGIKLGTYGKILAQQNIVDANTFAFKLSPVIAEIRSQGIQSVRSICKELNNRGIRTSRNNQWFDSTTYHLLKRIEILEMQN